MNNPYDDTLSININSQSDFILENIVRYKNLEKLELCNIKLDNFAIVRELSDDLNFTKIKTLSCNFRIKETNIQIKTINELIELRLNVLKSPDIKDFFLNLPNCINSIYIECPTTYNIFNDYNILNNSFTNLPVNLKKIEIEYRSSPGLQLEEYIRQLENSGMFNYLFGTKLPFGCEMILYVKNLQNIIYKLNVIYENNENDELTLLTVDYVDPETNEIVVKKIIIKYKIIIDMFNIHSTNYNVLRTL